MSFDDGWPSYVSVGARKSLAEREVAARLKKGEKIAPVRLAGKDITTTFWGTAWCDNLNSYADIAFRLDRGRLYVRQGMVIDLQIAPKEIKALVLGSLVYKVKIGIKALPGPVWQSLCRDCSGGIDSTVALLQGQLSEAVMKRFCRQDGGLFPTPPDMRFSCSCPDYASMCKHVAAVLYGVGARLDQQPELLFALRGVDHRELAAGLTVPAAEPVSGRVLAEDNLSALFGLEMGEVDVLPTPPPGAAVKLARKGKLELAAAPGKLKTGARRKAATREVPRKKS